MEAIPEAVQRCSSGDGLVFLCAGTICPAQGKLAKASGKKVACFGPVTSWHICCDGAQPEVCVLLVCSPQAHRSGLLLCHSVGKGSLHASSPA